MSKDLTVSNKNFLSVFQLSGGTSGLTMPFAREIFLLACRVAGTTYRPAIGDIEPTLEIGAKMRLQREPQNKVDNLAIAVYDARKNHLGYVPRAKNEVLARLLDSGKQLSAKLVAKKWSGAWLKLDIEIFLND
ncbi:hypothetical protein BH20ACI4_BH20ACI4_07840 [soil metagenome]